MPRRSFRKNGRRRRYDPNLWVTDNVAIASANTTVSNTIYTNSLATRVSLRFRKMQLNIAHNALTAVRVFFVLRRVPQGYTAPSATIATGATVWTDLPDVFGYGYIYMAAVASQTNQFPEDYTLILTRPTMTLFEGDTVVIQAVPDQSIASLSYTGVAEFDTTVL